MKTLAFAVIALCSVTFAGAQSYPVKPIRIVVPFPPGGTSDILSRMIGAEITKTWGQQVVVENRTGANGNIGAELVARSAPDGHTLLLMDVGNLTISPSLYKLPFNIIKDFAPVTTVSYSPHLLCVHPSVPVKTVRELVGLAKANPGKLNYGTGLGSAPHMAGLMLAYRTGVKWTYIPTRGGTDSILVVATGQSDLLFNGMLATLPHVTSGRLKLLAVSSERRVPSVPDVPTVAEAGNLPGFVTGSWQGMLGPSRMPADVVAKVNAAVVRILGQPDVTEKLAGHGSHAIANSPQEMGQWLVAEKDRWAKLIKDTGFKLE
ncbi:MAG: Bug family tripartite tricarboxylate transporter substrate binding protein [Burkholderiales bacterium]